MKVRVGFACCPAILSPRLVLLRLSGGTSRVILTGGLQVAPLEPALTLGSTVVARLSEKALGATPQQIKRELRTFSRAARLLSSNHPRLIDKHPKEWAGLYDGEVCATDKSFNGLIKKLKSRGISPQDAIIRYIDTSGRKLIL